MAIMKDFDMRKPFSYFFVYLCIHRVMLTIVQIFWGSEVTMSKERKEEYINPYTDFGFKKLFEQAEIAKYTNAERQQYEASLKEYWDYTSTMETAFRKGKKEGEKKGRQVEKTETARKMKSMGFDAETIAKITGLTVEEIDWF